MHISGYYRTLLQDTGEEEVREYLSNKLRQAEWVVRAVDQRRSTLLSCAEEIVRRQAGFFRRGDLVPLTMAEVACALNLHESTVSRAVRDKYLQCPRGLFPLSFFFSRGVGGRLRRGRHRPRGGQDPAAAPDPGGGPRQPPVRPEAVPGHGGAGGARSPGGRWPNTGTS